MQLSGSPSVPYEISGVLNRMTGLRHVDLSGCLMTAEVSAAVMSGLSHCFQLQNLDLSGNTLRNYLDNLIPKSSSGFHNLRRF